MNCDRKRVPSLRSPSKPQQGQLRQRSPAPSPEEKKDMSQWMLTCSSCGKEFTHSSIPENLPFVQLDLPHKSKFQPLRLLRLPTSQCLRPKVLRFQRGHTRSEA